MIRPAISVRRIAVARHDDLGAQLDSAAFGRVEIVDLEPQHAVAVRKFVAIADWPMMMVDVPLVQLHDEDAAMRQSLKFSAAMIAAAIQ